MMDDDNTSPLLYKYRAANRYTLDLLKGNLYFAQHQQLNDPTDLYPDRYAELQYNARVTWFEEEIEKLKEEAQVYQKVIEEIDEMNDYLLNQADDMPPEEWLREIESEKIAEIDRQTHRVPHRGHPKTLKSLKKAYNQKLEQIALKSQNLASLKRTWEVWKQGNPPDEILKKMSVLCLTIDMENYDMWTHYADGFRGVCIGFDQNLLTEFLTGRGYEIEGPIRVKYRRKMTAEVLMSPRFYHRMENRYKFKSTKWSTEKEVRFVRLDGFGPINVPVSCVKQIILGERLDSEFRRDLTEVILHDFLPAFTESDDLSVYQAIGDAEARVHILRDEDLTSLINNSSWGKMFKHERIPVEHTPSQSLVNPLPERMFRFGTPAFDMGDDPPLVNDVPPKEAPLPEEIPPEDDTPPKDLLPEDDHLLDFLLEEGDPLDVPPEDDTPPAGVPPEEDMSLSEEETPPAEDLAFNDG